MRKVVLTYGLIAGGILAALMVTSWVFQEQIGWDYGMLVGYTAMVMAFLMVYVGTRTYRDTELGGRISFGRGFGVAMAIVGIATACYVVAWQVVYTTLMPDFIERYAAHAIASATREGKTASEIAALTADMTKFAESYRNPLVRAAWTALEPLPVGLLYALVSAGVLSRKRASASAA